MLSSSVNIEKGGTSHGKSGVTSLLNGLWTSVTYSNATPLVALANMKPARTLQEGDASFLVKEEFEAACMAKRFEETYEKLKLEV